MINLNKIVLEAYKLANLHVIRLLENDVANIQIDKNFCYNCLIGVSKSSIKKNMMIKNSDLRESIKIYQSYRPIYYIISDNSYMNYYFQNISKQMITEFKNNDDLDWVFAVIEHYNQF